MQGWSLRFATSALIFSNLNFGSSASILDLLIDHPFHSIVLPNSSFQERGAPIIRRSMMAKANWRNAVDDGKGKKKSST